MLVVWLTTALADPVYGAIPVVSKSEQPAVNSVTRELRTDAFERRVRIWLTRPGTERVRLFPKQKGAPKLEELDRPLLDRLAAMLVDEQWKGVEQDFLVGAASERIPTTVIWDGNNVEVLQGDAFVVAGPEDDAVALASTHGLQGFRNGGREWSDPSIALVEDVLDLLSAEERATLKGVTFALEVQYVNGEGVADPDLAARYDPVANEVVLYDAVFASGFVGGVARPRPSGVLQVMHAVADVLDQAGRASGRAPSDKFKEKLGTVLVTASARENPESAFCAAFALYRSDPDALQRISPPAAAFFESGEHTP